MSNETTLYRVTNELAGLDDVTVTTPLNNQVLNFNGTEWVNESKSVTDLSGPSGVSGGYLVVPGDGGGPEIRPYATLYTAAQVDTALAGKANTTHTHAGTDITSTVPVARIPTAIPATSIGGGTVDNTELGYLDGVTSAIQTQLNSKAATATTISTTAPLTGGGSLAANRTFAISAATGSTAGSMSAAHYTAVNNATSVGTASTIVKRDASNRVEIDALNNFGVYSEVDSQYAMQFNTGLQEIHLNWTTFVPALQSDADLLLSATNDAYVSGNNIYLNGATFVTGGLSADTVTTNSVTSTSSPSTVTGFTLDTANSYVNGDQPLFVFSNGGSPVLKIVDRAPFFTEWWVGGNGSRTILMPNQTGTNTDGRLDIVGDSVFITPTNLFFGSTTVTRNGDASINNAGSQQPSKRLSLQASFSTATTAGALNAQIFYDVSGSELSLGYLSLGMFDHTGLAQIAPLKISNYNHVNIAVPTAAPTDAHVEAGYVTFWVDESGNNLKFKVKYSGGTVKSGSVALT